MPILLEPAATEPPSLQLMRVLNGRVCLLGVGNRFRRDDGAGSILAKRLAGCRGVQAIDAGAVPENHLEQVARCNPDTVIILDACDFDGAPGDARILDPKRIAASGLSTHAVSLQMVVRYLEARTRAHVVILAIQPADLGTGAELSGAVSRTLDRLADVMIGALRRHDDRQQMRADNDTAP